MKIRAALIIHGKTNPEQSIYVDLKAGGNNYGTHLFCKTWSDGVECGK